jgi:hypothetical protein
MGEEIPKKAARRKPVTEADLLRWSRLGSKPPYNPIGSSTNQPEEESTVPGQSIGVVPSEVLGDDEVEWPSGIPHNFRHDNPVQRLLLASTRSSPPTRSENTLSTYRGKMRLWHVSLILV